jgi:6-pyruvoyltetrahydropterin/6-carboxytetrahydropterin synthase
MVYLTRRYWFCASHRLHNPALGKEENLKLYGKCNNPGGHGHNYQLEVTVGGPIEPRTGLVVHLGELDDCVRTQVLDRFDKSNLNETRNFRTVVPTTENLNVEIHRILQEGLSSLPSAQHAVLECAKLEETSSNFFEYRGERAASTPQSREEIS